MRGNKSAIEALSALGDPSRRAIFERLAVCPTSVTDIAEKLPITRSAVSQHLRVLKEAGLVTDVSDGRQRIYRLDPRGIGAIREWLESQWTTSLDAFKSFADQKAREKRNPR